MLVLTRKLQEQISIGQDITITVLRLKGNTVRIGIEAPDSVRVVRGELPRFDATDETSECSPTAGSPSEIDTGARASAPQRQQRTPGLKAMVEQLSRHGHVAGRESAAESARVAVLAD